MATRKPAKKKKRTKIADWMVIKNDVYRRDIFFIVGKRAEIDAWFKKFNWDKIDTSRCLAKHFLFVWDDPDRTPRHFIIVRRDEPRDSLMVALAHELNHLVFTVFTDLGIPITKANDEAFNFYHSWLMQQMTKVI